MTKSTLPNLLDWRRDIEADTVFYRIENGLEKQTEILMKNDPNRVLPLGAPQGTLINHLLNFPEKVEGKDVFEPFAGSGAFGHMALKLGSRRVDFLDLNPRASSFQLENARRNGFGPARFEVHTGDIAQYSPARKPEVILANPPFVPTPDGIPGTLTSNGGPEGNRLVGLLLERLEELLEASGEAYIYVFQFMRDGRPLIADTLEAPLRRRPVELTPTQSAAIPFETYLATCHAFFSRSALVIQSWAEGLLDRYGGGVGLNHFVMHIGPRGDEATRVSVVPNVEEKYGEGFLT